MTTVLSNVILAECVLRAGVRGTNQRMNQRAVNQAGFMQANIIWTQTLRRYDVGFKPIETDAWEALLALHEVTEGGAYGFLMPDPADQVVAASQGLMRAYLDDYVGSIGVGYGLPTYRLFKRYTEPVSGRTKDRRISRPKPAIVGKRGASTLVEGVGPGNIAIDYDTGAVTFVADVSESISSITTGATTVLNFASGAGVVAALGSGDRVYVTGVTGTGASVLNDLSHPIASEGATSLTISTNTNGLTLASGTAAAYPQADEALTWAGNFYVPVQFEQDSLEWQILRPGDFEQRVVDGVGIVLVEIRE